MTSYLKRLSLLAAALTVAAVFVLPSAVVHGDEFNLKTYITVSQPFQVPGAVLQPNTKYVMRRLSADAGLNHVVRVLNEDETEVISTFHAISDYRLEPTDETLLTFMEVAPGYPRPVKSWFYPGRINGLEFIYSKQERAEIAAHAPGTQRAEIQTAQLTQDEEFTPVEEAPAPVALDQTADLDLPARQDDVVLEKPAEPVIEEPTPAPVEEVEAPAMDDSAANEQPADTNEELPRTAGELPLLGLIGIAALGLRQALRR